MSKPIVAVVGRPNVGKSTFFNKIVGRRVSIVEDTPGVTRDRIYAEAEWRGIQFAKIDNPGLPEDFYDFYELGLGEPVPVSAVNMLNLGDVLDMIVDNFPELPAEEEDESVKIAVVGKPNVGKSSLINALLGENRVIVSEIAGTTRDSIDTPFVKGDDKYVLIDTAGIRRKSKVSEHIERYSVIRAIAAIERCDVCLLMIDATEGVTEQDK